MNAVYVCETTMCLCLECQNDTSIEQTTHELTKQKMHSEWMDELNRVDVWSKVERK